MAAADLKNPYHNNYDSIIAVDIICVIIVIVCTSLRFYVRRFLLGKLFLDDWLLLAGVIIYTISCFCDGAAWMLRKQIGLANGDPGHVLELIDIFAFLFAEILVRGAYTAFYLKIVPKELNLDWHRYTMLGVFGMYATLQGVTAFIYLFQCGIPRNTYDTDETLRCVASSALASLFNAIFYCDCIFDWLMVLVPIRVIWTITMKRATRIGTVLVLSLGCCAGALAIVIISLSHRQADYSHASGANLRLAIQIDIAAACEIMVAILCLSFAAYRPLLRKWLDVGTDKDRAASDSCIRNGLPRIVDLASPDAGDGDQQIGIRLTKADKKVIYVTSGEVV